VTQYFLKAKTGSTVKRRYGAERRRQDAGYKEDSETIIYLKKKRKGGKILKRHLRAADSITCKRWRMDGWTSRAYRIIIKEWRKKESKRQTHLPHQARTRISLRASSLLHRCALQNLALFALLHPPRIMQSAMYQRKDQ